MDRVHYTGLRTAHAQKHEHVETCDTALLLRVWLFQFLLLLPTKSCALDSCSRRLGAMAEKSKKNNFSVDFKVSAVDLAKRTSVTAANKLKVT